MVEQIIQPIQFEQPVKKSKWWLWLILVIVLVGVAVGIFFLFFSEKEQKEQEEELEGNMFKVVCPTNKEYEKHSVNITYTRTDMEGQFTSTGSMRLYSEEEKANNPYSTSHCLFLAPFGCEDVDYEDGSLKLIVEYYIHKEKDYYLNIISIESEAGKCDPYSLKLEENIL